jgi:Mannosyltransferase (PIG-V)
MDETASSRSTNNEGLMRVISLLPKRDWLVVGWVLAIKLLLLLFGVKSFQILENKRVAGVHGWFEIWNRWDSLYYQKLAQFGYDAKDIVKSWFYPLFPWCVRLVAYLTSDYLVSAFIVSGFACLIAAILLRRLVILDYSPAVAQRTVWFFLIFPTAYFLHIGYSESLFLALSLGSLLAARTDRWWLAGVLGAFCWMTRATGLVLIPTLAAEAVHQYWITRRWNWRWLWIALIPAGFGVYLLVNWHVSGDAFAFLRMRRKLFAMSTSWPWEGIRGAIGNLRRPPADAEMVGAQELFFVALGLICAVVSWIKLRPIYAMWMTGSWLLFYSVTFIESAPRYTVTLFPIFMLFALVAANRFWNAVITVWSLLFFALFAALFVRGWWVF